ncbi:MAG: lipoprotein signal peptidase [Bacteroidota bacterium]
MDELNQLQQPARRATGYFLIAIAVIIIDQVSKMLVHKYMYIHQEITIFGYGDDQFGFKLHYLLNPGMAFGIRWKNEFGKLFLTGFRILAMIGISVYLYRSVMRAAHKGFLVSLALILGGAVGNVIDSIFYGVLLDNQLPGSVTPWFHGQVIDMLFFPLFEFTWPEWVPGLAGGNFLFFSPVFNIADSSIFVGVALILIFQKRYFQEEEEVRTDESSADSAPMAVTDEESTSHTPPAQQEN